MDWLEALRRDPLIAILRAGNAARFVQLAEVLYDSGVRHVECTLTTAGAVEALSDVRRLLPADAWVGAGTVTTDEQVDAAAEAGAQFMLSPIVRPAQVARARERGLPFLPGALSATEIVQAWETGPAAVKVSPIGCVGGPTYVRQTRGPLPHIPLVPTGGIGVDEVGDYLSAGALAVGIGGPLQGDAVAEDGDLAGLAERAKRAVAGTRR